MAKNKLHHVNTRIDDNLKIRLQAHAIKHRISESEVCRQALKIFLQTNVAKARDFIEGK